MDATLIISVSNCCLRFPGKQIQGIKVWEIWNKIREILETRMVVQGQLVKHSVCLSDLKTFNLPEQMFQMAFLLLKENSCAKLFKDPCIYVQVMAWTNPDRCTHTQCKMHIHQTEVVRTLSHSLQADSIKYQ